MLRIALAALHLLALGVGLGAVSGRARALNALAAALMARGYGARA